MAAGALEAGLVGLDPAVLTPFYVDVLGFTVATTLEYPQGTVHRLERGPARLKLYYPSPPARPRTPTPRWEDEAGFRYAALHLSSRREVRELADVIAARGGSQVMPPADVSPHKTFALVADPEHNVLELIWEG